MDGKRPSVQIMDSNGDGIYNAADGNVHRMTIYKGAQTQVVKGDRIINQGDNGERDVLARMPEQPARPSWRQLQ
jgi:type IV pilus assembly protein PilY1